MEVVAYGATTGAISHVAGAGPKQVMTGMAACGTDVLTLDMTGTLSIANTTEPAEATFGVQIEGLAIPTTDVAAGGDLVVCTTGTTVSVHRKSKEYAVLSTVEGLDYAPLRVAISPDESEVAVSSEEERGKSKKVVLYKVDGDTLTPFKELKDFRGAVFALAYSPDGKYLATGDGNREVRVHEIAKDYECLREDLQFNSSRVTCLAWHPDGESLISGDIGRNIVVTHLTKLLKPTVVERLTEGSISHCAFLSADLFAVADNTGVVYTADFKKL